MAGRILVLDDEENYARMVMELLRFERYNVEMATKPEAALQGLREKDYDLVISDYKMPLMDGAEFLVQARKVKPTLPVIMVSGLMNTPELLKVANTGVTLVLEKPFDTQVFLSYVKRFVEPEPEGTTMEEAPAPVEEAKATEMMGERVPYPRPLRFLSDVSEISAQFIQELWEQNRSGPILVVQAAPGAEFELVVREVAVWRGGSQKRPTFFQAPQIKTVTFADRLQQVQIDAEAGPVVGVDAFDETTVEQQESLLNTFRQASSTVVNGKRLSFVLRIGTPKYGTIVDGVSPMQFQVELAEKMAVLPPLRERLPDLALFARRYLRIFAHAERRPAKAELTVDAVRALLAYHWPGSFAELVAVLRRAVLLGNDAPLGPADIQAAVSRVAGEATDLPNGQTMSGYLEARQRAYVASLRQALPSGANLLGSLGIEASRIKTGVKAEEQPLLLPELLRP